jgi:hypothetical protein
MLITSSNKQLSKLQLASEVMSSTSTKVLYVLSIYDS